MTKDEWVEIRRMLLQWPQRRDRPIDDGAYVRCLRRFTAVEVAGAVERMVGVNRHVPLASEIAAAIPVVAEPGFVLTPSQRAAVARYELAARERWNAYERDDPDGAARVMGAVERLHGKQFVARHFPTSKREEAAGGNV